MMSGGRSFLLSPLLSRAGIPHGFGTRRTPPGAFPSPLFTLAQVHGDRLVAIEEPIPRQTFRFTEADALLTSLPGVGLGIRTADCLPLLLADPASGVLGAVHCGWRSLALGLAEKTVREMARRGGGKPSRFLAAAGPCIGPCCCEVGEEVREAFRAHPGAKSFRTRAGKLFLDLAAAAEEELRSAGLAAMERVAACTCCAPRKFHSWRGEKTKDRMTSWIGWG
jgi:YfiH family protein